MGDVHLDVDCCLPTPSLPCLNCQLGVTSAYCTTAACWPLAEAWHHTLTQHQFSHPCPSTLCSHLSEQSGSLLLLWQRPRPGQQLLHSITYHILKAIRKRSQHDRVLGHQHQGTTAQPVISERPGSALQARACALCAVRLHIGAHAIGTPMRAMVHQAAPV